MTYRRGDIYLATLPDGVRTGPVVIVTRNALLPVLNWLTVAAIVSRGKGLPFEVPVDATNGLDHDSVVNTTFVHTIPVDAFGPRLGELSLAQRAGLDRALRISLELDDPPF